MRLRPMLVVSLVGAFFGPVRINACDSNLVPVRSGCIEVCPTQGKSYELCGSRAGDHLLKMDRQVLSSARLHPVDGERVSVSDDDGSQVRIPAEMLKVFAGVSLDVRGAGENAFLHSFATRIGAHLDLAGSTGEPITLSAHDKDVRDVLEEVCEPRCAWTLKYLSDGWHLRVAMLVRPNRAQRLIRMEITSASTQEVVLRGTVQDGQSLIVEEAGGRALAFRPALDANPPKVQVYELGPHERLLDKTTVEIGDHSPGERLAGYFVRVLYVRILGSP